MLYAGAGDGYNDSYNTVVSTDSDVRGSMRSGTPLLDLRVNGLVEIPHYFGDEGYLEEGGYNNLE